MHKLKYYLPGSIVIAIGILIVAIPEILIAMVASFIMMAGILMLYWGHMIKKSEYRSVDLDQWSWGDNADTRAFFKNPRYSWWIRRF